MSLKWPKYAQVVLDKDLKIDKKKKLETYGIIFAPTALSSFFYS